MDRRAAIREEKAFLHQLLKISESITRLESLLLISSPEDEGKDSATVGTMQLTRTDTDAEDRRVHAHPVQCNTPSDSTARTRGNRAKHIARVAAEYTQLLYHVSRARTEPCAFIDESQWVCEMSLSRAPRWLADPTHPMACSGSTASSRRCRPTSTTSSRRRCRRWSAGKTARGAR